MNPTIATLKESVDEITTNVKEGNIKALPAYIEMNKAIKTLEAALAEVKAEAMKEATEYGQKTFTTQGATITIVEGRRMYKFDHVSAWQSAKSRIKYIEDISKAGGGVDPETGECIDPPQITYTAESISIKY